MSDYGDEPTPEPTPPPPAPQMGTPPPPPQYPQMPPPPTGAPVYGYYPPTYPQGYPAAYPPPAYYAPPNPYGYPRDHPQAGLALGLGLGALIGGFVTCGLGFLIGPFAWFFGQRARSEVRNSNGAYHSEGNATAGMVLGIIATVFLGLAIVFWILVIIGASNSSSDGGTSALHLLIGTAS